MGSIQSFVEAQMSLEDTVLTETSQAQRDKRCMSSLNAGSCKADLIESESAIMATRNWSREEIEGTDSRFLKSTLTVQSDYI